MFCFHKNMCKRSPNRLNLTEPIEETDFFCTKKSLNEQLFFYLRQELHSLNKFLFLFPVYTYFIY